MKILIAGASGQLGWELQRSAPAQMEVTALDSEALDICDKQRVQDVFAELLPDVIINAAAYTAVDKAEQESALAFEVNRDGALYLARSANLYSVRMIHVSTDFVFDGEQSRPYLINDHANPLSVYGASKLDGEEAVVNTLGDRSLVFRSSWLYSAHGHNFVKTMLRLMRERDKLHVVTDQVGTPTWAHGLAKAIWLAVSMQKLSGIHHWTDAGVASWYDFAVAIKEEAISLDYLDKAADVIPVMTWQYPLPAKRPAYSVLDKTETWSGLDTRAEHWRVSLRNMLKQLHS
jgi:dTDP-4-dehydrorhamnose reductase